MVAAMNSMTRADLSVALQQKACLSKREADALVEGIIARISDALASGEEVKIAEFGTFLLRDKDARPGRNPKTGDEHQVSARRVVLFRPSGMVRKRVA